MYLSLLAGDTVQAIGFILSFHYIDGPPATPSSTFCSAQGAFIQAGDLSIALSTTLLALHTCYVRGRPYDAVLTAQTVLRRRRAHRLVTRLAVPTIWLLVILSALVGPLVQPLFCARSLPRVSADRADEWVCRFAMARADLCRLGSGAG